MKKNLTRALSAALAFTLLAFSLGGCGQSDTAQASQSPESSSSAAVLSSSDHNTVDGTVAASLASIQSAAQALLTDAAGADESWTDATTVEFDGSEITVNGSGAKVSGSTLTISDAGTYVLHGTLTDGQIVIDAGKDDTVRLVLNGVSLTCTTSAPIYCKKSGETILTVADGTENSVTDGSQYNLAADEDEPNAAIFSKSDLILNGGGTLTVTANYNNGICSKDNLVITNGNINVTATNDAIRGRDCTVISGGTFTLSAGGDGIQSNNDEDAEKGYVFLTGGSFAISAGGDGIQAETALIISGGTFRITTSTSEANDSYKGLKAGVSLLVTGGEFTIDATDDALHSNGTLGVSGGTFAITSGDDGMHADGALVIDGGTVSITKSYEGVEGASVTVNGGTLDVTSSDDGFNAAGDSGSSDDARPGMNTSDTDNPYFIQFTGGTVHVNAGGDGIDSNGTLLFEGGEIYVSGPTDNGNGALDSQNALTVSGGVLVAAGSIGMAQAPDSSSTQNSLSFNLSAVQAGGTGIELRDSSGTVLVSFTPDKEYQSVVISSPEIAIGQSYTLYLGGTEYATVTASQVTTVSGTAAAGQMGGGPGGGGTGGRPSGGQMGGGPMGGGQTQQSGTSSS